MGQNVKLAKFINLYGCEIGDNTKIGAFVEVQKNARIGRNCKISSHTFICEGVTIEDDVFIGHGVIFINDIYPRATASDGGLQTGKDWKVEPTLIRRGASIGSGATILAKVTVGENAIVGAGIRRHAQRPGEFRSSWESGASVAKHRMNTMRDSTAHQLRKFLESPPRRADVLDNSAHGPSVHGVMPGNGHNSPAVRHDDVLSLPGNPEPSPHQSSDGSKVRNSGNLRNTLCRDFDFPQVLRARQVLRNFEVLADGVPNVLQGLLFSGALRPTSGKPRTGNTVPLFGGC